MSIEFVDGMPVFDLSQLLAELLGERKSVESDWEPNPDRYVSVLDLFKDHQKRLDESREDTESGMLTPRITIRDHGEMHLIATAMDEYMTKVADEWYNAAAAYGMGNNTETLESLTIRSREITDAAQLRHAINRLHVEWASEHGTPQYGVPSEPDDYTDENGTTVRGLEDDFENFQD